MKYLRNYRQLRVWARDLGLTVRWYETNSAVSTRVAARLLAATIIRIPSRKRPDFRKAI